MLKWSNGQCCELGEEGTNRWYFKLTPYHDIHFAISCSLEAIDEDVALQARSMSVLVANQGAQPSLAKPAPTKAHPRARNYSLGVMLHGLEKVY